MGYTDELDDTGEEEYQFDPWAHGQNSSHQYSRLSDRTTGNHTRLSGSVYPLPTHYYAAARDVPLPSSAKVQPKESVSSFLFCVTLFQLVHDGDVM